MMISLPWLQFLSDSLVLRLLLAASVFASLGIYVQLTKRQEKFQVLMSRLDRKIPFWPIFCVPYLLYFPFLFFTIGYGIIETPFFARIALSLLAVQFAAAAVYYFNQTHVPRPEVLAKDLFSRLTKVIYRFDSPHCTFPSLHVACSVVCGYWLTSIFAGITALVSSFVVAVMASTLFLKQHALADVVGGVSLAALCLMIVS